MLTTDARYVAGASQALSFTGKFTGPTSPGFGAASPSYSPASPGYSPKSPISYGASPGYSPTSPTYDPASPAYEPASPEPSTNSLQKLPAGTHAHNRTSEPPRKSTGGLPPRMQLASSAERNPLGPSTYSFDSVPDQDDADSEPPGKKRKSVKGLALPARASQMPLAAGKSTETEDVLAERAMEQLDEGTLLQRLIKRQSFEGSWGHDYLPYDDMDISGDAVQALVKEIVAAHGLDNREVSIVVVTATVVKFLEKKLSDDEDTWELIVEKARDWLDGAVSPDILAFVWKETEGIVGE